MMRKKRERGGWGKKGMLRNDERDNKTQRREEKRRESRGTQAMLHDSTVIFSLSLSHNHTHTQSHTHTITHTITHTPTPTITPKRISKIVGWLTECCLFG